jgi:hypothetical protein
MKNMFIDPKYFIGRTFPSPNDPNVEYTVIGYAQNDTFLLIATSSDKVNNRSSIKTFKLTDVQFRGDLTVPLP